MNNPETYVDIENPIVRSYNRAVTSLNIFDEDGEEATREYFQQFSEQDRASISVMMIAIKQDPVNVAKRVQEVVRATVN